MNAKNFSGIVMLALIANIAPLSAQNNPAASQELASPNTPPGNTPAASSTPTAPGATDFQPGNYLTGGWGGARKTLFDDGFSFTPVYVGEVMGNPSGGQRQGVIYEGLLNLTVDFDLCKMTGGDVNDLTIHANALEIHGPSLSTYDTGDFSTTSSIAAYNSLRLDELWVQKCFWDQQLSIKVGNISIDDDFLLSSTAALFIGPTFGDFTLIANNIPNVPTYPTASPGIRLQVNPVPEMYMLAGVFGLDKNANQAVNDQNGTLFAFNRNSGVLIMTETGYLLNQGPDAKGLQGSYRLGSFVDTANFYTWSSQAALANGTGPLKSAGADFGIYGIVDQQVYVKDCESVSFFVRAGAAPSNTNFVDAYCDCGCNLAGFVPGRPNDNCGVAMARSHVSHDFSNSQVDQGLLPYTAETFFEATYRIQLQPWWSVQPVVQYIVTPSGQQGSKNAPVLGVRSSLAF